MTEERLRRDPRGEAQKKALLNRLARIEGQIKGIKAMVQLDRNCADVLVQVVAAEKGLRAFGVSVARQHYTDCVLPDVQEGGQQLAEEFFKLFEQLAK